MKLMNGPRALRAGVTFLHEGIYNIRLQSGVSFKLYASPFYPASRDGTFPHVAYRFNTSQDRFNPLDKVTRHCVSTTINPIPDFSKVDIVMIQFPPL